MSPMYRRPDETITIDDDDVIQHDFEEGGVCEEEEKAIVLAIQASLQSTPESSLSRSKSPGSGPATPRARTKTASTRKRTSSPIPEVIDFCTSFIDEKIVVGDTVELQYGDGCNPDNRSKDKGRPDMTNLPSGDFLRVHGIYKDWSNGGKTFVKGILFRRTKYMKGVFTRKMNEVCMLLGPYNDGQKGALDQSMVSRPIDMVVMKRDLCLTNEDFPSHSFRGLQNSKGLSKHDVFYEQRLICRWAHIGKDFARDDEGFKKGKPHWLSELALIRLTPKLCQRILHPKDQLVSVHELRQINDRTIRLDNTEEESEDIVEQFKTQSVEPDWELIDSRSRGSNLDNAIDIDAESNLEVSIQFSRPKIRGKDRDLNSRPLPIMTHSFSEPSPTPRQYTFGDAFSGGGGASQSARMAGLNVVVAVDRDPACTVVYEKNHRGAQMFTETIDQFIHRFPGSWPKIDILHISPPCQFFSPAKTKPSEQDEENRAALFSVYHLTEAVQPRAVTLEQTFGIQVQTKHKAFFYALLGMFTTNGYNVRAKTFLFADFDSEQSRKRLIIFATRNDIPLMDFPPPVRSEHGSDGLRPWRTVRDFLEEIKDLPRGPLHEPEKMPRLYEPRRNFDDRFQTVMTRGKILHPSGERELTLLECAILQGFPKDYDWTDPQVKESEIRKQIGNAVPPNVFQHFLAHVRKHLEKVDAERGTDGVED